MFIIGTAGHIDHGKSSIVRRLTGTDPDRLPEEQLREMTIDLGFAFANTPSGEEIGFIDVPGHERFVRNMIAGAAGIDAVMLVIAADDGWMPQSQEHFQIVRLLGVTRGLIVINKCDLVEKDWLDLLELELREKCKGTFLETAPAVRVSAETGSGFDDLSAAIAELAAQSIAERDIGRARLYIDRSFHRPGMGGVVTGTMRDGTMHIGQTVSIWPIQKPAKIRAMQSRGESIERAGPGQRTAMSFTGIERNELVRGGAVTSRENLSYFHDHPILALSLEMLREAAVNVSNRRRLLLILGTAEVAGEVRIYGDAPLEPGNSGIVFFIPDDPIFALAGDHYVVRLPTPMVTIGGGRVLDHFERVPRRRDFSQYRFLNQRAGWFIDDVVLSELVKHSIAKRPTLLEAAAIPRERIEQSIDRAVRSGAAKIIGEYVYHVERFEAEGTELLKRLSNYFQENTHINALTLEEIFGLGGLPRWKTEMTLQLLRDHGRIIFENDSVKPAGHDISLSGAVRKAYDDITKELATNPFAPPTLASLAGKGKDYKDAIKYIITIGEGHKCGVDFVFPAKAWNDITRFVKSRLSTAGALAVADLRDKFGLSRKYVIPIFEETDRIGLTRREGDVRVKGNKFEG